MISQLASHVKQDGILPPRLEEGPSTSAKSGGLAGSPGVLGRPKWGGDLPGERRAAGPNGLYKPLGLIRMESR